jgi:hypothetical protein
MGDAGVGLVLGLGVDPAAGNAGIQSFGATLDSLGESSKVSLDKVAEATQPFEKSLLTNRESVRLLTEELGIHMPRAVTSAISEMLPAIGGLGGAFLAAFAIEQIPKLIRGIHDAADEMAGFGKEAKKAFEDVIAESDKAITHFKTIKEGIKLEAEINRNIAALTVQRDGLDSTGGVAINYARAVMEFLSGNFAAAAGYGAMARAQQLDMAELGKLEGQRLEQLNTRGQLETKAHKEAAEDARSEIDAVKKVAGENEKLLQIRVRLNEELQKAAKEANAGIAHDAAEKQFHDQFLLNEATQTFNEDLVRQRAQVASLAPVLITHAQTLRRVTEEMVIWNRVTDEAKAIHTSFMSAIKDEVATIRDDMAGSIEGITGQVAELIGGIKAVAAVRGAWDIAKSIECWAQFMESGFTDWPAALAAVKYDLAAAEMFKVAGGGGGGRSSRGGGGAASGARGSNANGTIPQTLAPGPAGGGGGRFGPGSGLVMIFGGRDVHAWMAQTVTEATNRGFTVQATSAQRGSPVGH